MPPVAPRLPLFGVRSFAALSHVDINTIVKVNVTHRNAYLCAHQNESESLCGRKYFRGLGSRGFVVVRAAAGWRCTGIVGRQIESESVSAAKTQMSIVIVAK